LHLSRQAAGPEIFGYILVCIISTMRATCPTHYRGHTLCCFGSAGWKLCQVHILYVPSAIWLAWILAG